MTEPAVTELEPAVAAAVRFLQVAGQNANAVTTELVEAACRTVIDNRESHSVLATRFRDVAGLVAVNHLLSVGRGKTNALQLVFLLLELPPDPSEEAFVSSAFALDSALRKAVSDRPHLLGMLEHLSSNLPPRLAKHMSFWGLQSLLNVTRSHIDDADVCLAVVSVVAAIFHRAPKAKRPDSPDECFFVLCDVLNKHVAHAELARAACRAMVLLAGDMDSIPPMPTDGSDPDDATLMSLMSAMASSCSPWASGAAIEAAVFAAMKHHPDCSSIAGSSLHMLRRNLLDDIDTAKKHEDGTTRAATLVTVLRRQCDSVAVVRAASTALARWKFKAANATALVEAGLAAALSAALYCHVADAELTVEILAALSCDCGNLPSEPKPSPEDPVFRELLSNVLAALHAHASNEDVLCNGLFVLGRLAYHELLGAAVAAGGGIDAAVATLRRFPDSADVANAAAFCVLNLAQAPAEHVAQLAGSGAGELVANALAVHLRKAQVVCNCMVALDLLVQASTACMDIMSAPARIAAIVEALKLHAKQPAVVLAAGELVLALLKSPSAVVALVDGGALAALLACMRRSGRDRDRDRDTIAFAARVFAVLAGSDPRGAAGVPALVDPSPGGAHVRALVAVLTANMEHKLCAISVAMCTATLTLNRANSVALLECGGAEALAETLQRYGSEARLAQAVLSTFMLLAAESKRSPRLPAVCIAAAADVVSRHSGDPDVVRVAAMLAPPEPASGSASAAADADP